MRKYKKVTEELKETMKKMKDKGLTYKAIGKILFLSPSTIQYHLDPKSRAKAIERSMKNEKPRDRKEYNKEYRLKRYNSDDEFRERVKKHAREYWRRKNGI